MRIALRSMTTLLVAAALFGQTAPAPANSPVQPLPPVRQPRSVLSPKSGLPKHSITAPKGNTTKKKTWFPFGNRNKK